MALVGVAGAGAARVVAQELAPLLAAATVVLLGRAHWSVTVRRRGAAWSRRVVWISTALAAALWLRRLL